MKIVCAWCGKDIGEKPPYEDKDVTHGICEECLAKYFPKVAKKAREAKSPIWRGLLPPSPTEGPPLPRAWGVKWPWKR